MTSCTRSRGFTLIEVSIVVAIIALLAAIAIPSYQDSVRKGRRATAQGCLTELSQFMERYYATQLTYVDADIPAIQCVAELNGFYAFSFPAAPAASTYTIRAAPVAGSGQASDKCGTMTLNQRGEKTPTTPADCWR